MVQCAEEDVSLVREAQRLTSGAEIHDTRGIVSMYRAAVSDGNAQHIGVMHTELTKHVQLLRSRRFRI